MSEGQNEAVPGGRGLCLLGLLSSLFPPGPGSLLLHGVFRYSLYMGLLQPSPSHKGRDREGRRPSKGLWKNRLKPWKLEMWQKSTHWGLIKQ